MKVRKHCVFCGNPPDAKSKEHVVPKWLIAMTGKPSRKARFGFSKDLQSGKMEERAFAFDKFTFPACSVCNQNYSDLENRAKSYVGRILSGESLTGTEASDFLDWFDKVRVGVWLGMRQLDQNLADVEPNFHINTRVGQFDRMLIVERSDMHQPRLNLGGTETLCFALTPGAFLLIVNDFYFTNVSGMFLCSRRLGFPFIRGARLHPDREEIEVDLVGGRNRIMTPVLRRKVSEIGLRIFQPMYKGGLMQGNTSVYDSDYVREHSMTVGSGTGNIYAESRAGVVEYGQDDEICLTPQLIQDERTLHVASAINILEWQTWLHEDKPDMQLLSTAQRSYVRHRFGIADRVNRSFIQHYRGML